MSESARTPARGLLVPAVAMGVLTALALLPMPYGYYALMRVGACGLSLWAAWRLWPVNQGLAAVMIGVGVLYNPIVPVHLGSKVLWALVNIATVFAFINAHVTVSGHKAQEHHLEDSQ